MAKMADIIAIPAFMRPFGISAILVCSSPLYNIGGGLEVNFCPANHPQRIDSACLPLTSLGPNEGIFKYSYPINPIAFWILASATLKL